MILKLFAYDHDPQKFFIWSSIMFLMIKTSLLVSQILRGQCCLWWLSSSNFWSPSTMWSKSKCKTKYTPNDKVAFCSGRRRRRSDQPLLQRPPGSQSKHQHQHQPFMFVLVLKFTHGNTIYTHVSQTDMYQMYDKLLHCTFYTLTSLMLMLIQQSDCKTNRGWSGLTTPRGNMYLSS